jgi:membrane peptidoglycan carboxypeptidase
MRLRLGTEDKSTSREKGFFSRLRNMGKLKIIILSFLVLMLVPCIILFSFYVQVARSTKDHIERGAINKVIFSESPVYSDDGNSIIGVFFDKTHSKYTPYKDIPPIFIKAVVASEDRYFFTHPGFDIKAILRAFIANVRSGKVMQGGSTLTQQTAKNIFKREKRSYKAKLKELVQALLLEQKYTKEEILEMYINQFFVTGFGRGIGIASQYFFDKEPDDLDLVEAAFIAGSVKGPYKYNPFTKRTEADKFEAIRQAKLRKDYVLRNMYMMRFITEGQYTAAKDKQVPFKEGKVTFGLNVILDYIRDQLESDYYRSILNEQGVDNIATSGVRIYTSINKEIQEGALKSIRKHLPLMDVKLSGYKGMGAKDGYFEPTEQPLKRPKEEIPFLSRITKINTGPRNPSIMVTWDDGGGVIDYNGLKASGEAWLKGELGNWAEFGRSHVPDFLKNFKPGDLVTVFLPKTELEGSHQKIMLSKIPELNGGIVVLREGMIKAMVGGFHDRYFNRAVDAKRQLGSIFKPLVYTAALQLKWNSLDPLINQKDLFHYQATNYVPRPDHDPESDKISMAWAGVMSENLATVWLLYHLTDRLNMSEFRQVVELVGLDRRQDESYKAYVERIRDKHGVVVNEAAVMGAAFDVSTKEIEADLIFEGYEDALANLQRLHLKLPDKVLDKKNADHIHISRHSFERLKTLNFEMKRKFESLKQFTTPDLFDRLRFFYFKEVIGRGYRVVYTDLDASMRGSELQPITPEWLSGRLENMKVEEMWIDDLIPSKVLDLLQSHLKDNYQRMLSYKRYDPELLFKVRDFRTLVNLIYVAQLSKKMGIFTELEPVLSFPLGANAISIMDAALAYQTIMAGKVYQLTKGPNAGLVPVITRIEDREGETIWEYNPQPKTVLSNKISGLVTEILRMVMVNGTGKKAKDAVRVSLDMENDKIDIPIPSFGKTGTSNRFRNSSFVGFIPGPKKEMGLLGIDKGYVIASYVGYDDNRPMKGKQVSIYGASGALPLWIDTANAISNSKEYKKWLEVADLVFDIQSMTLGHDEDLHPISVSSTTGLPKDAKDKEGPGNYSQLLSYVEENGDGLKLRRVFEPSGPLKGDDNEENPLH